MRKRIEKEEGEIMAETSKAVGLKSRVKKAGKKMNSSAIPSFAKGEAGLYEVVHGRILLGYEDGEPVYVNEGGQVELSADEAGRMLAEKTVKKVA